MSQLELMTEFYSEVLIPSLYKMPANIPLSKEADVLLLATAATESGFTERRQVGGPARGYFQFERGGGVAAVLGNTTTYNILSGLCGPKNIPADADTVYEAIAWNDELAVWLARLFYWLNPAKLPGYGDGAAALAYYVNTWRPGKPDDGTRFLPAYTNAMQIVRDAAA